MTRTKETIESDLPMKTRAIQMQGYMGEGKPLMVCDNFLLPAEPEERSQHSEACVRCVIESGEYRYPRADVEDVETILDIGLNLGAFTVWAARCWWPARVKRVFAYEPNAAAFEIAKANVLPLAEMGVELNLFCTAVSVDPAPLFVDTDTLGRQNWGGGRTHGITEGVRVPAIHPRELPACEVLKVDAEGVDADVLDEYQHWAGVKVAVWEWHDVPHRARMEAACLRAGLTQMRGDAGEVHGIGQQCWVRP